MYNFLATRNYKLKSILPQICVHHELFLKLLLFFPLKGRYVISSYSGTGNDEQWMKILVLNKLRLITFEMH